MAAAFRTVELLSEMLWVSGLVLLHIVCANQWIQADREEKEWACYLVLGTLFPAIGLTISLLKSWPRVPAPLLEGLKLFLAASLALVSIPFLVGNATPTVLLISSAQGLLLLAALASRSEGLSLRSLRQVVDPETIALALAGALVLAIAWTIVGTIVYWQSFSEMIRSDAYSLIAFAIALSLVSLTLFPYGKSTARPGAALVSVTNLGGALVIALFAFNTAPILSWDSSFEHWAWAAGPAQLVREGGWLLWDVHATYGFLSTLAIAAIPASSTWQSLYALNSILLFSSGLLIFLLFRGIGRGCVNFMTALLVTVSAVFLMPGRAESISGAQVYPSVGAFRFFWCFVLLGVLVWNCVRPGMKNRLRKVAWTGCFAWLLGSLWSAESAAYCTAIWIPAYILIIWEWFGTRGEAAGRPPARVISNAVLWLFIPPMLASAAVGLISAYYLLELGHFPDFMAYLESTLAFGSGFNVKPIDPTGNVWVLVLVFCIVSTFAAHLLGHGSRFLPLLSVVSGLFGAIWATGSSFVPHSHWAQVLNLAPIYCASIAILLLVFSRNPSHWQVVTLLKIGMVPVLTVVVFSTFGNERPLGEYLKRGYAGYKEQIGFASQVDQLIPLEELGTRELLDRAGVRPGDPITSLQRDLLGRIAYLGDDGLRLVRSEHPAFLPIKPAWALAALSKREDRIRQFIARWIERREPSGWLLVPRRRPYLPWVVGMVRRTHEATREFSDREWRLIWMEFRREGAKSGRLPTSGSAR